MAWILGYKANPFALDYGGTSWNNLLLLENIDENVNYRMIYDLGHNFEAALIAFAGAGFANGSLYILSLYLLKKPKIKSQPYLYYFIFFFNLMNLGNFYDYVPIRTFASHGDMAIIEIALNISPWWIYIIVGYLVIFLIWHFFTRTLIGAYQVLNFDSTLTRASLMILTVAILFGFFGGIVGVYLSKNPLNYGEISRFLSITSFVMIPGIIIAAWPSRAWVKRLCSMEISNKSIAYTSQLK